jgi:hypothetical protein
MTRANNGRFIAKEDETEGLGPITLVSGDAEPRLKYPDRFTNGMVVTVGDTVTWDGEAHGLGVKPHETLKQVKASQRRFKRMLARAKARDPKG